jgi:hypothetical protein
MSDYQEEITESSSSHQDDAIRSAFGLEPEDVKSEPDDKPEADSEPEPQQEAAPDPEESKARQHGWTSKSEWIEQGKNPDDWVNAKHFNDKGELIRQSRELKNLEKTFTERVQNVQKLAQMQAQIQLQNLQQENEKLKFERRQAINYGDVDAVEKLDSQLMNNAITQVNIQQQIQQPQQQGPSQDELAVEADFERNNAWISVTDPLSPDFAKAEYARRAYQQLLTSVPDVNQRLQLLQQEITSKFPTKPTVNPNRDKAPMTDSKSGRVSSGGELTWADLSPDEKHQWNSFGESMFGDKKSFLKAVKDSRRA